MVNWESGRFGLPAASAAWTVQVVQARLFGLQCNDSLTCQEACSNSDTVDRKNESLTEIRKSGNFENTDFRIAGNPDFRKSDLRNSGKPENPDFQVFRFPVFSENRKVLKSGKKASDVELAHVEIPLKSMMIVKS